MVKALSKDEGKKGSEALEQLEAGQKLPPLNICGIVVSKAQLLEALKVYVPGITDFSPLPDSQHFYILFSTDGQQPRTTA